jgi:hypothetical protein
MTRLAVGSPPRRQDSTEKAGDAPARRPESRAGVMRWVRSCAGAFSALWLLVLLAPSASGGEVIEAIRSRLGDPPVVRGEFEQRKYLEALKKPLVSRGDFLVARDRGLVWRTRTPSAQTVRLTRSGISQEQDGETRFRISADREPGVRAVIRILLPLFGADFDRLKPQFQITGRIQGEGWRAVLRPIPAPLLQVFKELRLEGASHVERVELLEANGDRTEIRFTRVQLGGNLAPEEERLLE